jgi:hypothetical protein
VWILLRRLRLGLRLLPRLYFGRLILILPKRRGPQRQRTGSSRPLQPLSSRYGGRSQLKVGSSLRDSTKLRFVTR